MPHASQHPMWGREPLLKLPDCDAEHDRIVACIDAFAILASAGSVPTVEAVHERLDALIVALREHFAAEEVLISEVGLDGRHLRRHASEHGAFVQHVEAIDASRGFDTREGLRALHEYLRSWFAFHVRGEDIVMARQIKAVRSGQSPVDAYLAEERDLLSEGPARTLLETLGNMVNLIVSRNVALAEAEDSLRNANRLLEQRVVERTHELEARNEALRESLEQLEATQNQLMQSERLASIGQLAAGVAHEINNPVGFVNSNLGTLTHYLDDLLRLLDAYAETESALPEETRARLARLREQCDLAFVRGDIVDLVSESREGLSRVTSIIQDLKSFAHVDNNEWQTVDLLAGLESTLNVVYNELRYKAVIVREFERLPLVACLPGQINQVFMNLLVNAADAITDRGTITLRCGVVGDEVWIEIEDTGSGMPAEVQRRIFDPFFTTKPVGKGTGLGLPLSFGIVSRHRGRIEVDSAPGAGTRMRVWLPIAQDDAADDETADNSSATG
ncbi:MAG: hemerythrin domain-containing protein [Azoarcus sp.]|nr:hemerythrin domain-containing protein [Azoarcus sp.]